MLTHAERASRRERIAGWVAALPGGAVTGGPHLSLEVNGKRFGWLLDDHHGDGRLALNCRLPQGRNEALAASGKSLYHLPKYVSHRGWAGLWLDLPGLEMDWEAVGETLLEAYLMTAPKKLALPKQGPPPL